MAAHTLRIDHGQLQGVGVREAHRLVTRVLRRTLNRSAILCPVDNGPLRASGRIQPATARGAVVVGGVIYDIEYAAAVHEGRRALTIRAKRPGGRLKFIVGGRTVFARQVHQPARAGRPFLAMALREVATQEGFVVIG
jgi:hypothetical protein